MSQARAWIEAVGRDEIARELEAVYANVSREIESRGPACWASGRCCNFVKAGHRLYVTGLEAAYALTRARRESGPRDVTLAQIGHARQRGDCPYLEGNLCGAHAVKPLGCRVYFCDRTAQVWQQELSERGLARVRELHDRFGVPYRYGEWREMLELFVV